MIIEPLIIELSVDYVLADNNIINLSIDTSDSKGFEFGIIAVEKSKITDMTLVGCNDIDEMIEILKDLKKRWKSLKKD